jgi:hypothetical protein
VDAGTCLGFIVWRLPSLSRFFITLVTKAPCPDSDAFCIFSYRSRLGYGIASAELGLPALGLPELAFHILQDKKREC